MLDVVEVLCEIHNFFFLKYVQIYLLEAETAPLFCFSDVSSAVHLVVEEEDGGLGRYVS